MTSGAAALLILEAAYDLLPFAIRALTLSLTPRAIRCHDSICKRLSDPLRAWPATPVHDVSSPIQGTAGLHIAFGNPRPITPELGAAMATAARTDRAETVR